MPVSVTVAFMRDLNDLQANRDAEHLVESAEVANVLPAVMLRLQRVFASERGTVAEAVEVIRGDPKLTHELIAMANRGGFARLRAVTRLESAVERLGLKSVRDASLALALAEEVSGGPMVRNRLCRHMLATGCIAAELVRGHRGFLVGDAFVAGVLHDIGILVLFDLGPEWYGDLVAQAGRTMLGLEALEFADIGFDHTQLGDLCLRRWGFSNEVCMGVKTHHDDIQTALGETVALADELEVGLGVGLPVEAVVEEAMDHRGAVSLALGVEDLQKRLEKGLIEYKRIIEACGR